MSTLRSSVLSLALFFCFTSAANAQSSQQAAAPLSPFNLVAYLEDGIVALEWGPGLDEETPQEQLTYDVRVGTSAGASDIIQPNEIRTGNNGNSTILYLQGLNKGPIYWSVATVDAEFERSEFAAEQVFDFPNSAFRFSGVDIPDFGVWGDYDNDGDFDIFVQPYVPVGEVNTATILILKNDGGSFSEVQTDIPSGDIQLADYDNDNDLDVLLHTNLGDGKNRSDEVSRLYRNDNQKFVDTGIDPGTSFLCFVESHPRVLLDVDNNGRLDLVSPYEELGGFGGVIGVRLNKGGVFADAYEDWGPTNASGSVVVGDYDTDGRIDLLSSGLDTGACFGGTSGLNRNVGGSFEFIKPDIQQGWTGEPAWGDWDADGDMDVITAGSSFGDISLPRIDGSFSGVYRNDQGSFSLIASLLPNSNGTPVWGDYDMDGDLDVLLPSETASPLFENRNGVFVNILGAFDDIELETARWGDFDGDQDLDALVSGYMDGKFIARIYINVLSDGNNAPRPPSGLMTSVDGSSVTFAWDPSVDGETPTPGLTYNLRVGTTPGGNDIMSPASLSKGLILQPVWGNTYHNTKWTLNDLSDGTYYWSVQSVDGSFVGSPFASEASFKVGEDEDPPLFTDAGMNIDGFDEGGADWGDYDNDGYLDLLITGTTNNGATTRLYRNTDNGFVDANLGFKALDLASLKWGDYDNDGDLDFVVTGRGDGDTHNSILYTNTGAVFEGDASQLPGVLEGSVDWGDYDNDGDLDLLLTGLLGSLDNFAGVFRNDGGRFTDIEAGLTGIRRGGIAWVDYDVDGDLDILTTGRIDNVINRRTFLYSNDDGVFTPESTPFPDVDLSSVAWGDYDEDGDPDLLITGTTGSEFVARVFRNDGGSFADINAGLPGVEFSSARWGDADNDGDLDIFLSGAVPGDRLAAVYINNSGSFSALDVAFTGVSKSAVAWADYDLDGDLDVFVMGEQGSNNRLATLYTNNSSAINEFPDPPVEFWQEIALETVTLNWDMGNDEETAREGLTYNVRIGTTSGGTDVLAPMAGESGNREVVRSGNVGHATSWSIRLLKAGVYYWSVQSIDAAFEGSKFGSEQSFVLLDDLLPVELTSFDAVLSGEDVVLSWETASETNNAGFDVERSLDGGAFAKVAHVEGQGTAVSASSYAYTDTYLPFNAEQLHYRLKQIDFDGQVAYSPVVQVDVEIPSQASLWPNYPNPFNPSTQIRYEIPVSGEVKLVVFDATGKEVQVLVDGFKEAGRYETTFDALNLASGIYFYRLTSGNDAVMRQMILTK